jgi:hypothetical protein
VLVEVGLEPIERPGGEGQAQTPGVGHRGGEDLGDLLRGIGGRASGAGLVLQAVGPLEVEPRDPAVDGGPRDAQVACELGGALAPCGGQDNLGALDGAGRCGAGVGQRLDLLAFLGRQGSERDSFRHGGISDRVLPSFYVTRLGGCTIWPRIKKKLTVTDLGGMSAGMVT